MFKFLKIASFCAFPIVLSALTGTVLTDKSKVELNFMNIQVSQKASKLILSTTLSCSTLLALLKLDNTSKLRRDNHE